MKDDHFEEDNHDAPIDEFIIPMLLEIMENKDQLTMIHSSRVQRIVNYFIPDLLEHKVIQEEDVADLWVSAILHDIGKIFVKDTILESRLKLNNNEYAHIRYHPLRGYRLVKQLDLPKNILLAIRHHHERWDGRIKGRFPGYPDGLKGKKIPLYARIIGIADAFDAMVSKRPYKRPMTLMKALDIIKNNSGKQFDPRIAKLFVQRMKQIAKEHGRF